MSGFLLTVFLLGSLGAAVLAPVLTMYVFEYVTYMVPKFTLYGPGVHWPWAAISGFTAIFLWFFFDKKRLTHLSVYFFMLKIWLVWINVTTYFGKAVQFQIDYKHELAQKTIVAAIVMCVLLNSRIIIEGLIVVLIAAFGFYIGRGFVVTILAGGSGQFVTGEEHTILGDRNYFALPVWMLIPMLMWLSAHTTIFPKNKIFQLALIGFALASIVTIVGTQSRGAFVAAPVFFAFYFFQSEKKFAFIIFGLLAAVAVLFVAPDEWWERMQSITNYEEDGSALSRLNSWAFAWDYALNHPILGGGFRIFTQNIDPQVLRWRDAHSIYFEVLAEHGFVGFFLFFGLMFGLVYSGFGLRRRCQPYPDLAWAGDLGLKLSVSILLYLSAGAFLTVAFHPIAYDYAVLMMAVIHVVNREVAEREEMVRGKYHKLRFSSDEPQQPNPEAGVAMASEGVSPKAGKEKPQRQTWLERRQAKQAEAEAKSQGQGRERPRSLYN